MLEHAETHQATGAGAFPSTTTPYTPHDELYGQWAGNYVVVVLCGPDVSPSHRLASVAQLLRLMRYVATNKECTTYVRSTAS